MSYFGQLATGIVMSVGAMCVSGTDAPGPVHHRTNAMLLCNLVIGIVAIVVGFTAGSVVLLGIIIFVFGFIFSMLTVYGLRSSSLGIAALIVMILNQRTPLHGIDIFTNAFYILTGGTWYMLFSLTLFKIRPYKLIQQILGDFIQSIAIYLKTRGSFYADKPDYEKGYQLLLQQQTEVQTQQNLLSEVLFKTRSIVKESTQTGRILLKIYLDVADLFESVMTTYQDHRILHEEFDSTGILKEFEHLIMLLSNELDEIGIAIKRGVRSYADKKNMQEISRTREHYEKLRLNFMTNENVEHFVSLGRILNNIQDLAEKIDSLHYYIGYDKKIKKIQSEDIDFKIYIEPTDIRPSLFFNNLNFKSNVFRHSLRVCVALLVGYIISLFFKIGHSYWILLTIVVILKPAYSLTKKRNKDRLIGTFLGIIIGVIILVLIKNSTALLIIMILFMTITYVFLRTNYFLSVLFMTPYLVIFFHMLYPDNLKLILTDRILDTAIGSGIAFLSSIFFVPQWEHRTIKLNMVQILESNKKYYTVIAKIFSGLSSYNADELRIARRDVLVELANLSDAFTRMLSEPKRFQKNSESIHHFVVLNHTLTSHISTLSYYLNIKKNKFRSNDLLPVIDNTELYFSNAIQYLESSEKADMKPDKNSLKKVNEYADTLLGKRRQEISLGQLETETKKSLVEVKSVIDQFNYIFTIAADIYKSSTEIVI